MPRIYQNIHGVILFDKPLGLSSNTALQIVRRIYAAAKGGHTGSLDPLATGLLPICFGEATKFSRFLLEADKHYTVTAKLGEKTDTSDAEGRIIETRALVNFTEENIEAVLEEFRGPSLQIPSMYSALKHQGRPLYEWARQGIDIPREPRPIDIYDLKLIQHWPDSLILNVHCSKGTYIRTLVEDIGERLGCGAHVTALRRTAAGPFKAPQLLTLDELQQCDPAALMRHLWPIDCLLQGWPKISVNETALFYLRRGQAVRINHQASQSLEIALYDEQDQFMGIGKILDDGRVAPGRLVQFESATS